MNQTQLIMIARYGPQLSADGLQSNKESAIHDRDSSTSSGSASLKAEVLTLQKSGSFHSASTACYFACERPGRIITRDHSGCW